MGTKLSALAAVSALTGSESVPLVQAGATMRATPDQIAALATDNGALGAVQLSDYGVLADGATDDTAALQTGLNVDTSGAPMWGKGSSARTTSTLTLTRNGANIRDLKLAPDFVGNSSVLALGSDVYTATTLLSADTALGDYYIDVVSAAGMAAGDPLVIRFDSPTWIAADPSAANYYFVTLISSIVGTRIYLVDNVPQPITHGWTHYVRTYANALRDCTLEIEIDASAFNPRAAVTSITKANPAVVTVASTSDFTNGLNATITGPLAGMTEIHGTRAAVAGKTTTTFQLSGVNSTAYTTYNTALEGGQAYAQIEGNVLTGFIVNCRLKLKIKNASSGGIQLSGAYGCEIEIEPDGCGSDLYADIDGYCYTQTRWDIRSRNPSGFGPTLHGGHYSQVFVQGSARAATGRGLKVAKSRFCTFYGGGVTNPGYTGLAATWATQDCIFIGFQCLGGNRPNVSAGAALWTSACYNTDNKFIGCTFRAGLNYDIDVHDTDTGNIFIGCDYDPARVRLSGTAVGTTSFIGGIFTVPGDVTISRSAVGGSVIETVENTGTGAATSAYRDLKTGTANSYARQLLQDGAGSPFFLGTLGTAVEAWYWNGPFTVWRDNAGVEYARAGPTAFNIPTASSYKINSLKVVGVRKTGWTVSTGTAQRSGFATYTSPTISGGYVQAEVQAIADGLQATSRTLKALVDDLHGTAGHGLIGT